MCATSLTTKHVVTILSRVLPSVRNRTPKTATTATRLEETAVIVVATQDVEVVEAAAAAKMTTARLL
jgi:hypothetical protein